MSADINGGDVSVAPDPHEISGDGSSEYLEPQPRGQEENWKDLQTSGVHPNSNRSGEIRTGSTARVARLRQAYLHDDFEQPNSLVSLCGRIVCNTEFVLSFLPGLVATRQTRKLAPASTFSRV